MSNTYPGDAIVVMYGTGGDGFRFPDVCPKCGQLKHFGDCWTVATTKPDLGVLLTPLVKCNDCKRHIVRGTECPFCFAMALQRLGSESVVQTNPTSASKFGENIRR